MYIELREKFNKTLSSLSYSYQFTDITAFIFMFWGLSSIVIYLILGDSTYINSKSILLMILLAALFFISLKKSNYSNSAHILILSWFIILYLCVRFFALLTFPDYTIEFLIEDNLTKDEIAAGLVYIFFGCMALLVGIFAASYFFSLPKKNEVINVDFFSIWSITFYWLLTYIAAYYVRIYLGVTIFGSPEQWGNRMAWIGIIFDTDIALILTIVWASIKWRNVGLTKFQILHVSALILIWLAFTVLIGSRGGPLRILNCIFLVSIAINPIFRISLIRFIALIALFFIINFYVFTLGSIARSYHVDPNHNLTEVLQNRKAKKDENQKLKASSVASIASKRVALNNLKFFQNVTEALAPTVQRLAVIDYALVILARNPNQDVIDYYIRSFHPIKNFINNMVPGEIFLDSTVNTSRVFTMAYRGTSLDAINQGFSSEPWTIWGMTWIFLGYYGILAICLVGALMQIGLTSIPLLSTKSLVYSRAVYFILIINIGYIMFGIDHWFTAIAHFSLSSCIAIYILRFYDFLGFKNDSK